MKIKFLIKKWLSLCLLLSGVACERELDIELPEEAPRLVVYAFLESGSPLEVRLSATRPALSEEPFVFPEDARVMLYADGALVDTLRFGLDPRGAPRYRSQTIPQLGTSYTLRAAWSELPEIAAVAELPPPVAVQSWQWDTVRSSNPNLGEDTYWLYARVALAPTPGAEAFYALQVAEVVQSFYTDAQGDTIFYRPDTLWTELDTDLSGPVFGYSGNGLLLSGEALDGGEARFTCRLAASDGYRRSHGFLLYVRRVSRAHFLFHRDVYQNGFSNDLSFFSEPVEVYNNIFDGFGNFSGVQQVVFRVPW
jgi:hypothetical protein